MKKLLYINLDFKKYKNKALAEMDAFEKLKISTEMATIEEEKNINYFKVYDYDKGNINLLHCVELCESFEVEQGKNDLLTLVKRGIRTIRLNSKFKRELIKYYQCNGNYDYCYIRRIGFFVIFLSKIFKVISRNSDILYEIPTYPLDKYDSTLVNVAQSIEMMYFNVFIKKYIKNIPIMLQNDVKLDDKMISICNGINYDKFKNVEVNIPELNDTIYMVAIANVLPWHGYDRLIESIYNYKGKYNIKLDIYSEINSEVNKLMKLVEKYNLKSCICFKGKQPLEKILDKIGKYHIAIGSLGYHRRNGKYDTSIKNKEYCAMGLPIVCSAKDLSFPDDFKYIYKVSSDDEIFNIEKIINWYIELSKSNYKEYMITYAKNNLEYEKEFKKVFK